MLDTGVKFYAAPAPTQWSWGQGHGLGNFMFKCLVKVFKSQYEWNWLILCLMLDTKLSHLSAHKVSRENRIV